MVAVLHSAILHFSLAQEIVCDLKLRVTSSHADCTQTGDLMRHSISSVVTTALVSAVICSAACAGIVKGAQGNSGNSDSELLPTGKGWGERPANFQGPNGNGNAYGQGNGNRPSSNGISY